jgi:DNA (cytosine-5)-methyltransferase 1
MKTISLFTGAGGLDLGLEAAGFQISICVDRDADARQTLSANRPNWRLLQPGDIDDHSPEEMLTQAILKRGEAALLAAGPPCQPFSKAAYWANGDTHRLADPRSKTLTAYLGVVEAALPQVLLLENVDGLSYRGKREALDFLLDGIEQINRRLGVRYHPCVFCLNSADFGVPQIRQRTYLVADRDGRSFTPPSATHGPAGRNRTVEPYLTAWDAIGDLDMPDWDASLRPRGKWAGLLPSVPEGHNYLWHTSRSGGWPLFGWRTRFWSFLLKLSKNQPSWTISAHPGPSTGPFHWRNRSLSTRELCRLQTFPDGFRVFGGHTAARRQLGNAVPPLIGEILGREIAVQLLGAVPSAMLRCQLDRRGDCPPPEPVAPVPPDYWSLIGHYPAHPGVGKGPRASRRTRYDIL